MKTKILTSLLISMLLGIASCNITDDPIEEILTKETFSGYVQKGPFISGSSVAISELNEELNQTGRSYFTTVTGNSGNFEQKQVELISNYVQLKADGYYFNEVSGKSSPGQLTLYALADISQVSSANVNVLTHLERSRVEYLVQQQGFSFDAAKTQALQEVLAIFSLELPEQATSESLNLTNHGILLAVSCILQGQLSTAAMSELMSGIISDIRADGTLDEPSLGSQLIDNARLVNMSTIRGNLEEKYAEPGMGNADVPGFESFVQKFIEETTYEPKTFITYSATGQHGINILAEEVTKIEAERFYSMKAELPEGTSLKVVLKNGLWYYRSLPAPENWTVGDYDLATRTQVFTVTQSGIPGDLRIAVTEGEITMEIYENGAITPTRVKQLVAEAKQANIVANLVGKWELRNLTGGFAPSETFIDNEVVWEFYPKDTIIVNINKTISDISRLPYKENGILHYSADSLLLSIRDYSDENYNYEYRVEENSLKIIDNLVSDGIMLEFEKE